MSQISEELKFNFPADYENASRNVSENSKRHFKFHTETLPHELRRLESAIKAFSKIKLDDRGLPW